MVGATQQLLPARLRRATTPSNAISAATVWRCAFISRSSLLKQYHLILINYDFDYFISRPVTHIGKNAAISLDYWAAILKLMARASALQRDAIRLQNWYFTAPPPRRRFPHLRTPPPTPASFSIIRRHAFWMAPRVTHRRPPCRLFIWKRNIYWFPVVIMACTPWLFSAISLI